MRNAGHTVTIVSRDKDLLQLLEEGDKFWDFAGKKTIAHHPGHGTRSACARNKCPTFSALPGDSVDNIPGVPGVGPKTAARLLSHFESIDDMYANLEQVAGLPLRGAAQTRRSALRAPRAG